MSRMAAKFGGVGGAPSGHGQPSPSTTSTGGTGSHPHQHQTQKGKGRERKAKKFCTRGEEFFEFLKGLGYQPSKHQQFEHFEYLFQDNTSISFVRKFLSTLKTQHCLLPEEIERYDALQKQGLVMYGADLEEAVARRRTINEMYSQQKFKRLAKKEDMEKELVLREAELQRLNALEAVFEKQSLDEQAQQAEVCHMGDFFHVLIGKAERDIEIDLKMLNEKSEELEKSVLQLKKDLSVHRPKRSSANYVCQIEGRRLLENEEKLYETIQEMIRKHGTSLIMKEAGYRIEGDPLSVENIRKVFVQYEKDFDRLKHCIIYEKVKQLSTGIDLAGQEGTSDSLKECCRKAAQLSEFDHETRTKIQRDTREAINNITIAYQREEEELLDHSRETTLIAVNKIFSALTNINTRSKKKLHEFFTVATNVLKAQKVRISLIRNLVKAEAQLYGRLLSNIEENLAVSSKLSKKLLKTTSVEVTDLTLYGQILHSLLIHFGIRNPLSVIASVPKILTFVRKATWEIGKLYWSTMAEKKTDFQDKRKCLMKIQDVQAVMRKTPSEDSGEGSQGRSADAEEYIKQLEGKLKALQQSRITICKELMKQRESNKQKCKEALSSEEKDKS